MRKIVFLFFSVIVIVALTGCSYTSKPKKEQKQEENYRCSISIVQKIS